MKPSHKAQLLSRRRLIDASAHSLAALSMFQVNAFGLAAENPEPGREIDAAPSVRGRPTHFQHACMTLPYSSFPLDRALRGIQASGFRYVAWGVRHREENGEQVPVMAEDAPPESAKTLGKKCRDLGLEPVMMFSTVYPEHPNGLKILTDRIKQASAAGIGQVLTFGHTQDGNRRLWIERFKRLGPIARDHGVMIVIKQHGGTTGTGEACAEIVRAVNDANILVNYDAGNVMDYLNLDPIDDIQKCANEIRSFCIKDHRNWPKDQDCGPGFGEIDHYRLLEPMAFKGLTIPLAYENIAAPLVPRPTNPDAVDALARRAREYLETIIEGLQQAG
jgi:sugar phosphate isomerase/epimerase